MLKQSWKILGVLLVLYAIIAGFTIPLKPGIRSVNPSSCASGDTIILSVLTYNSRWDLVNGTTEKNALLKIKPDFIISANSMEIESRNRLSLEFIIPDILPDDKNVSESILILDNALDGPSVFPAALFINKMDDSREKKMNASIWRSGEDIVFHTKDSIAFPFRNILEETIRNIFFHVSLWFSMFILFIVSLVYSIQYLRAYNVRFDNIATSFALTGVIYGLMGTATGAIWAKYTWGTFWTTDVKLNMTAILLLIYLAYFMLRSSVQDIDRKRKLASAYNIFAFIMIIPLIFVIPRMTDSLHPGNGGNPGLGGEDLDHTLRMVFYPAVLGFTLLGVWIAGLFIRLRNIEEQLWTKAFKKQDINLFESEK